MSLGDWLAAKRDTETAVGGLPSVGSTAITLSDWLQKKKDDFKPEVRIQNFQKQAEQALDEDNYEDAVSLFSTAIDLAPNESHLYANRSYSHLMVNKYESALTDAQKAIELSEESAAKRQKTSKDPETDYYRHRNKLMYYFKARALRQLKRFQESIDTLVLAQTLAIDCQFIDDEIKDIKLEVICDLGYDRPDVEQVSNLFNSIEELIKLLRQTKQLMVTNGSADQLPSNPFKYCGLYVNGLDKDLEEKALEELLSSCGELLRCKVYSNADQSRAIIAFIEDQSVRAAIRTIRSHEEIIRGKSVDNLVFRYRHTCVEGGSDLRSDPQIHFKGTEIGGECFKWRTTGCDDDKCSALHIPVCHHLDQQSIETKSVDRKRQLIVFESSPQTDSTPNRQRIKSSDKQSNGFDTNGTESVESPKSLTSPSKRMRTPIVFDIEGDTDSQTKDNVKRVAPINGAVVRLKSSSQTETNGLSSTPNSSQKSQRKRIVFDLVDDYKDKDSPNDKCLKDVKTSRPVRPPTPPNGRNVASYDDLFD